MSSRPTNLSPSLRMLAALALMAFVVAQAMCFVHCHSGGSTVEDSLPSCHRSASASDEPASPAPSPDSSSATCTNLKNMQAGGDVATIVAPQAQALYLLSPFVFTLTAPEALPTAFGSRQDRPREWVFTPEVSLGPALHSLAPPFVG